MHEEVIARQQQHMLELSTPVVKTFLRSTLLPIWSWCGRPCAHGQWETEQKYFGGEPRQAVRARAVELGQVRKVQEFVTPWPPGALLILHSDGLSARWRLDRYPGLALRDPALIAGVLYRDFQHSRDDSCVVVVRTGRTTTAA